MGQISFSPSPLQLIFVPAATLQSRRQRDITPYRFLAIYCRRFSRRLFITSYR